MASKYLQEFGFTVFLRRQAKWVREGKDCVLFDFFKAQRLSQNQIDELLENLTDSTLETQREIAEIVSPEILVSAFEEYRRTTECTEYNEIRFDQMVEELSALIDNGILDINDPLEEIPNLVA